MSVDFYDKLSDLNLLKRAWHLARNDSRTDFMFDPYRFSDFGFRLDDYLQGISQSIRSQTYHPKPLLVIDVPKSSLAVRPGTVLSIEDKIVLFAIACLIAPKLDKMLPPDVYSWRVKTNTKSKELFYDYELLKYPFLKKRTIIKRLDFVEPWYEMWPKFIVNSETAYEKEGYRYMVVSDIVSYFENIHLDILRDTCLCHLPKQPRIVNFLINLLKYWAWPSVHGTTSPNGIPQGNGVSSFLGNIYLMPLDKAFISLKKKSDIIYLRYMDDIKILAKDMPTARDALFLMNKTLRELRLNIQGSKTHILQGNEIKDELIDSRLNDVNNIIDEIKKKSSITNAERNSYANKLQKYLFHVKGKKKIIRDKELRLFRRLMTGFTLLEHSKIVRIVLDQLERNPDTRLLNSAIRYLRIQERNLKIIADRLAKLLGKNDGLFEYQRAHLFMAMRYVRKIPPETWKEAKRTIRLRKTHSYVKQQAAILLGLKVLDNRELQSIRKIFDDEGNTEVKRALGHALSQLGIEELKKVTDSLVFSMELNLQKLGRFFHGLLYDERKGLQQIQSIFNGYSEDHILDRLFEIELLSKSSSTNVRSLLLKKMESEFRKIRRPLLKQRFQIIIKRLDT